MTNTTKEEAPRRMYRVGLRQDAWQHYTALVHAVSAKEACEAAMDRYNGEENGVDLVKEDISTYDDVSCEPEDDVELIEEEDEEQAWDEHAASVEAEKNPPTLVGFDGRQLATVLAALRSWQQGGHCIADELMDVATNCGDYDILDDAEIDALCERMNLGGK